MSEEIMNSPPTIKLRSKLPHYPHVNVTEADVAAAIIADPVLIRYQQKEEETYASEARALQRQEEIRDRLNAEYLRLADAEATVTMINRNIRSIKGEITSAKYAATVAEKTRAQIGKRWIARELSVFKSLIAKSLRGMNRDLLPRKQYAPALDLDE